MIGPAGSFESVVDDKEKNAFFTGIHTLHYLILVHRIHAVYNHIESFLKSSKSSSFNFV